jgi:hypothetical protein
MWRLAYVTDPQIFVLFARSLSFFAGVQPVILYGTADCISSFKD